MIHKAKNLSPDQRLVIESLIGQQLSEDDNISVRKLSLSGTLSANRREEILEALRKYFARIDAQRQPVSAETANEILDEALRSTRPNYRPVR